MLPLSCTTAGRTVARYRWLSCRLAPINRTPLEQPAPEKHPIRPGRRRRACRGARLLRAAVIDLVIAVAARLDDSALSSEGLRGYAATWSRARRVTQP